MAIISKLGYVIVTRQHDARATAVSAAPASTWQEREMTESGIQLRRDPAFQRFLGASVGKDANGTKVTVLSMLARLGVDPWDEAADLSAMPEGPAGHKLEALIARFRDVPTLVADRGRIASDLVAFLPRPPTAATVRPGGATARPALPRFGAPLYWIIVTILFLGWVVVLAQGN
jgi:hypothetical protein